MQEKSGKSRIDQLVEKAGEKLASSYTRRSFLGRVAGVAGAAMLGGAVVLGEKNAAEASAYAGCYSRYESNFCYYGYRGSWSGGFGLHVGPSCSFPYWLIADGSKLGLKSQRMLPPCTNIYGEGPCSAAGYDMYWCYVGSGAYKGYQGWVYAGVLVQDFSWNACGPADADFDCVHGYVCGNTCGGPGLPAVTNYNSYWRITSTSWPHLRNAPNSTPWGYVYSGDIVHRIRNIASQACDCVTCWRTAYAPYGCHGWIGTAQLGTPDSPGGSGGFGCCKNG